MGRSLSKLLPMGLALSLACFSACGGEPTPEDDSGCQKVDILFIVDNSGSMADNQANLIHNFPTFAENIETKLGLGIDYHVGVATSDAYSDNAPQCRMLGALVSQTTGPDGIIQSCFEAGRSERFLTSADDVSASFSCIANVGTAGSPAEDLIGAAQTALAGTGTGICNQGFLRPDSLLVLVFLTDEDTFTVDDISDWEDGLAAVEIGLNAAPTDHFTSKWIKSIADGSQHHPDNTVVVSITTGVRGNQCGTEEVGQDASMLLDYTARYKYHHTVDICAESYGQPLLAALEPVDTACQNYEPKLATEIAAAPERVDSKCGAEGPSQPSWIMMLAAIAAAAVVSTLFLFTTLARSLASGGRTQASSNAASYGGGLAFAGITGFVVVWSHGCGLWGWFGITPLIVAGLGGLFFVIAMMTGRR